MADLSRPSGPDRGAVAAALVAGLAIAASLVLVWVGDRFPRPLLTTPIYLGLLALAVAAGRRASRAEDTDSVVLTDRLCVRAAALVTLPLLPILLSRIPYQGIVIYPDPSGLLTGTAALVGAAAVAMLVRPPRPVVALAMLLGGALLIRLFGFAAWELHPGTRDMLPLVVSALETLLAGGNPYGVHTMQIGSQIPLTYPPAMWLSYLPPHLLGLDIRWTNVVADALVVLGLGLPALRHGGLAGRAVLPGLAAYLFVPDTHWNGIYAEPHVDWAVLALLLGQVIRRDVRTAGLLYGVALLTRPFNVLLAPVLLVWTWRRFGLRAGLRLWLAAAAVAAAGFLPFVLPDPDAFYFGTVRWLLHYGEAHSTWFHGLLGFSGPLYAADRAAWMRIAQGLVVLLGLGALGAGLRRGRGFATASALGTGLFVYAGFVAFNSLIWMSFWVSVSLFALAAAAAGRDGEPPGGEAAGSGALSPGGARLATLPWRSWEVALAVVAAVSAAVLVGLLARHLDGRGGEQAAAAIRADLQPGDHLVDQSTWRLFFVRAPWLLADGDLLSGVTIGPDPVTARAPRPRPERPWADRLHVIDRTGNAAPWIEALSAGPAAPYAVGVEERRGPWRRLRLDRQLLAGPALDELLAGASAQALPDDGSAALPAQSEGGQHTFPSFGDWARVGPRTCRVDGLSRGMVWAHPLPDHTLEVRLPLPEGARAVTLVAALDDGAPEWGRAAVAIDVAVEPAGAGTTRLVVPNAPGFRVVTVGVPAASEALRVSVSAPDAGRRHLCLDGVVWLSDPGR